MVTKTEHRKALFAFSRIVKFYKEIDTNIRPIKTVFRVKRFWEIMGDRAVVDLAAFIEYSRNTGVEDDKIIVTVLYDLDNAGSKTFVPWSSGYDNNLRILRSLKRKAKREMEDKAETENKLNAKMQD